MKMKKKTASAARSRGRGASPHGYGAIDDPSRYRQEDCDVVGFQNFLASEPLVALNLSPQTDGGKLLKVSEVQVSGYAPVAGAPVYQVEIDID